MVNILAKVYKSNNNNRAINIHLHQLNNGPQYLNQQLDWLCFSHSGLFPGDHRVATLPILVQQQQFASPSVACSAACCVHAEAHSHCLTNVVTQIHRSTHKQSPCVRGDRM